MTERVAVTQDVLDGIECVRRSGLTNMFDRPVVAQIAEEMGFAQAAEWIRKNPGQYSAGVIRGFEARP